MKQESKAKQDQESKVDELGEVELLTVAGGCPKKIQFWADDPLPWPPKQPTVWIEKL